MKRISPTGALGSLAVLFAVLALAPAPGSFFQGRPLRWIPVGLVFLSF